jgi:hypothetical protein
MRIFAKTAGIGDLTGRLACAEQRAAAQQMRLSDHRNKRLRLGFSAAYSVQSRERDEI